MRTAREMLDDQFLEMRWRCLSLAADLDRVQNLTGGADLLAADPQVKKLHQAFLLLADPSSNRAERVQMIFSDVSK